MTGNEIREKFLQFFEGKGHRQVRSASLVPHGDPTLLFTNAGMNQFKDVFLGLERRDYTRATSCQKCVRAGGKHNDLENVGFTKRHHTFFEMLGNFSFGDYFKKDAIAYAWELITSPQWFAIPKDKLYVTIFGGAEISPGNMLEIDTPAGQCWLAERVPQERIHAIPGLKENFWAMGDTGPCGPCSEIHYDMGPAASEEGHADCKFPCDCGRYVEIWNLVFMQFNRDASGTLTPLPKPCVDTGMGLERVAAVLQGVVSNYDTDLFVPLMKRAAELCGSELVLEDKVEEGKGGAASLRVIADHSRATTFLINDGVLPSNEGRGYVLRKIMRRAIRHGYLLGMSESFLDRMVDSVCDLMKDAYPELTESQSRTSQVVLSEEKQFRRTIQLASEKLDELIRSARADETKTCLNAFLQIHPEWDKEFAKRDVETFLPERLIDPRRHAGELLVVKESLLQLRSYYQEHWHPKLSGTQGFNLYETYGLPQDFIEDACRDAGVDVDWVGFQAAMEEQRKKARASWKGGAKEAANPAYAKIVDRFTTELDFYFGTTAKDCGIEAIITKNGPVNELKAGESGEVVLDRTAIYAESGGQVADTGAFYDNPESQLLAEVKGAFYPVAGLVAHKVVAKETLRVGDRVAVVADSERRARIIRNHTGTHLVNAALRNILGTHVKQSGSLNAPERLRFDFSHFAHVDAEELRDIEQQVNDEIRLNSEVETNVTSLEEALASGALAFFGDKYPEHNVRVVTIPDPRAARGFYSKELCGGTHVQRVGDIGMLKIVSEESVAAGVRRIEAVTGIGALEHFQKQADILRQLASQLNVGKEGILAEVEKLSQTAKQLERELEAQKRKGALSQIDELAGRVQVVKGIKLIAAEVQNVDREGLRQLVDSLRQKLGSGVVALGMPENGKVALIAGVTKDLTAKVHAGKLIQALAKQLGGSGGGRPDLAEAGAKDTAGLKSALLSIPSLLEPLL
ncbi:MAG: alanine--tRNA ligase [Acidobacteria bacterium]|nr:MAG: alanine--tRNA ligase [Acidobacteriota bacterium]PYT56138.1 MAG: alanine--tRNA ligase [Acidobacteriota bacterium]